MYTDDVSFLFPATSAANLIGPIEDNFQFKKPIFGGLSRLSF